MRKFLYTFMGGYEQNTFDHFYNGMGVIGMFWVACFALTFVFPVLFGSKNGRGLLGPSSNFLLFAGINFLYFTIILKAVPETKGKLLEEIEKELTGKRLTS